MTRYYTNFEDSDCGEFPVGWTRRFDFDDSRSKHIASVEIGTPIVKRRQLRIYSTFQNLSMISYDAIDADANRGNLDMHFHFKRQNLGSPSEPGTGVYAWARGSGTTAAGNGYRLFLGMADSGFPGIFVQRYQGGVVLASPINAFPFSFSASKNYFVRWNVQDLPGSPSTVQLSVKVWADDSGPEPSAWTTQALESGGGLFGATGWTGISGSGNSASVRAPIIFNYISIGTNGDAAFVPKTNAEFLTWLDNQAANRVVLTEMQAWGYEANALLRNAQPPNDEAYALFLGVPSGSPNERIVQTPDTADNSFSSASGMTVMADINPDDWTNPNGVRILGSKGDATGLDFGWFFQAPTTGSQAKLQFAWSPNGSSTPFATSTDFLPAFGTRIKVAAELLLDNGAGGTTVRFWVSYDKGKTWGQLGADVIGVGTSTIFNSSQPIEIGSQQNGLFSFKGKMYRFETWYGRAISDPDNAVRVSDFYPQKMDPALYAAGTYKSLYTGEAYTVVAGLLKAKQDSSAAFRNCYISNKGYTSQQWDSPSYQFYPAWVTKIPSFTRAMALTLSGSATTGIGSFTVSNPADATGGVRDKWVRIKWRRDFVRQLLGDISWARADFRTIILGRLGQPSLSVDGIVFPIADLSLTLQDTLQDNLYASGDLIGKPKPMLAGYNSFIEPALINGTTFEYQMNDGPMSTQNSIAGTIVNMMQLLVDNWVSITTQNSVSAVNAATDVLTSPTPHGMAAGGTLFFNSGTPPAPLVTLTPYYVIAAGLTANNFEVSATPGGAAINITGATTGATFYYQPTTFYPTKGTLAMVSKPAGRLTLGYVRGAVGSGTDGNVADMLDWIVFKKFGLPQDFRDPASFTRLAAAMPVANYQAGIYFPPGSPVLTRDALLAATNGTFTWFGFTPDGVLQVGKFAPPTNLTADNVMSFIESDVKLDSLKLVNRVLPVDFSKVQVTHQPKQYIAGPAGTNDPFYSLPNFARSPLVANTTGTPLDSAPGASDMRVDINFNTLLVEAQTLQQDLASLFGKMIGVYEFQTRFRAMNLNIGDQIQLTHSKEDWELFFTPTNQASPDNASSIQPTAIVIGSEVNLDSDDPFPVKLTVYRQIPGYYPTANLT